MSPTSLSRTLLIVRVRAWNKENILPQRMDFILSLLKKNVKVKFFDIQPERKLGYYLGYLFSFIMSYPRLLFTSFDSVIVENPYLVIFAPIFKIRRKKLLAEYVDYYPANLHRLQQDRFFRYQMAKVVCRVFQHFTNVIITESKTGERTLQHWGVPLRKISIIPHGIDTSKMIFSLSQRDLLRKKYNISNDTTVIGYLGKMVKYYSLDNILVAISKLKSTQKKIQVVFVGDGPHRPTLELLSTKLNLNIIFTGNVPHNEVNGYYSLMDVFIFPLNSLAIKIGELLSVKGPILIVRKGMAEDWIQDGINGLVSKNSLPSEIKKSLERFFNLSKVEIDSLRETQRNFALTTLDRKIVTKLYLKLL